MECHEFIITSCVFLIDDTIRRVISSSTCSLPINWSPITIKRAKYSPFSWHLFKNVCYRLFFCYCRFPCYCYHHDCFSIPRIRTWRIRIGRNWIWRSWIWRSCHCWSSRIRIWFDLVNKVLLPICQDISLI